MINRNDEINSSIDRIKIDANLKDRVMNVQKAHARINSYNKSLLNRKRMHAIANFVIIFAIIVLTTNSVTYALSGKSVFQAFFSKSEYIANELMDYNGQKVVIDDYTFELKQTLYDRETGIGYLVFAIDKKESKPEIVLNDAKQCTKLGFGEDDRFNIELVCSVMDRTYEYIGDTLYAYVSFMVDERIKDEFNIYIWDQKMNDEEKCASLYSFKIKQTENVLKYNYKSDRISISPLGISVKTNTKIDDVENEDDEKIDIVVKLYLKDGTVREVLNKKTGLGTNGSHSGYSWSEDCGAFYEFQAVFKEMFDINKIKKIEYNGNILE